MKDSRENIWVSGPLDSSDVDIWASLFQTDEISASLLLTDQTNLMEDLGDEISEQVPPIDQTNPIQEFSREQEKTDLGPLQDRNSQQETPGSSPLHVETNREEAAETSAKPRRGHKKREQGKTDLGPIQDRNSQQETPGSLPLHVETNREEAAETSAKPRRGRKKREQGKTDLGPLQDRNSQQETPGWSPLHVESNHGHQFDQVAETSAKPSGKGGKRKLNDIQKEKHNISSKKYRQKQKDKLKAAEKMQSTCEELENKLQRLANERESEKNKIEEEKKQIQRFEEQMKKQRSQNYELQGQNNNVNEMIVECLALIEASNANMPAAAADFFRKLEEDKKRNVDSKEFAGVDEDRKRREVGNYQIPLSLVPTANRITKFHGDVCATSTMSPIHTENIYILFCATIKEMSELRLEEVTEKTMLKWRDAIKDALSVKFKVEFAMEHLKKTVAPRYFGMKLKACEEAEKIEVIPKVEAYLNGSKECKKLRDIAKEFDDQPFSEGLWG